MNYISIFPLQRIGNAFNRIACPIYADKRGVSMIHKLDRGFKSKNRLYERENCTEKQEKIKTIPGDLRRIFPKALRRVGERRL